MRRDKSTLVKAAFATMLGILCVPHPASAQSDFQPDIPVPPYNPYPALPGFTPPNILPPDIQPELYRVRREVNTVFARYFAEWQALTPTPTYMGNPPILVPNGYEAQRILGGLLNFDETMSPFNNTACASCHMPYTAFSGPIPSVNLTMIVPIVTGPRNGRRNGTRIHTHSPFSTSIRYRACSSAETSGMGVRLE